MPLLLINASSGPGYCNKISQEMTLLAVRLEDFLKRCSCLPPRLRSRIWRLQFNEHSAAGTNVETTVHGGKLPSSQERLALDVSSSWSSTEFLGNFHEIFTYWGSQVMLQTVITPVSQWINSQLLKGNFFRLLKDGSVNDYAKTTSLTFEQEKLVHYSYFHQTNLKEE